ncbi:probable multidrug resistance-associated protein lethal(2)03659 [Anabrus simplex]|uniref:probable multidrug resistance-associated protein lethal(2)03659 n=1 Tax=Anabrus simplex TaxID=316456 RepID=UPI0035A3B89F
MEDLENKSKMNPNPRASAGPCSALTFWWILGTFWKGYKRDLEVEDMYAPLKEHRSDYLGDKFEKYWNQELRQSVEKRKKPSLTRVIVRCFGLKLAFYGLILACMELFLRVGQPLFLGRLIRFYRSDTRVSENDAYLYAISVVLCSVANIFVIHPYMMAIFHMGMKMRVACCSLIYRKALKLSKTALGETTAGQVVNLLANDVNRFDVGVIFLHYLWIAPLETLLITYFLWNEVGLSAVLGVATIIIFIPLQGYLGKKTSTLRLKTAIRTDERVRLMNEIISGIQVIKMYTWEMPFNKLVSLARKHEIVTIKYTSYIRGIMLSFIMFSTRIAIFITILSYVLFDNRVNAEKVFVLTAYYNILRQTMTVFFPQGIAQVAEAFVSVNRLQKFLLYDETMVPHPSKNRSPEEQQRPGKITQENGKKKEKELGVWLNNGTAKWTPQSVEYTLSNVTLNVGPGKLLGIIGPVGAGKTSLLHVILGELPLQSGSLEVNGKVSYASQEPWMFAGSVRQNILFGQPFDKERYNQVIKVCALKRDFQLLPYGDRTIVGERGISLSGGQRARVNLARAVYMDADVYLLDDPLSAVDTHVGKHLFEDCISGYLRSKTVILITHQLQYLKHVDQIIILNNGAVEARGTYNELHASGLDFAKLLEDQKEEEEGENSEDVIPLSTNLRHSIGSVNSESERLDRPEEVAEFRTTGHVSSTVYTQYFAAGGNCCMVLFMFFMCVLAQGTASGADYWIMYWTKIEEERTLSSLRDVNGTEEISSNSTTISEISNSTTISNSTVISGSELLSTETCIYIYSAIIAAVVVVALCRSFLFFTVCMRASRRLHDRMFNCVTHACMRFFNTNTSGRILNRFSKDMGSIDELLPQCMIDTLQIGLALIGIIVVIAAVNYFLLIPTAIILFVFYLMRVYYLATSRSIKRLEGITRSPVFSHLNASLQGLTTIRAFGAQDILEKEFDAHQDLHSSAWFIFIASSRAFGFWLDCICVMYIAIVTFSFLINSSNVFGGDVGLAISQALTLTGMFQWGMRQSAEMENQMTSVERVLEYNQVEQEPPLESEPGKKPPPDWPQRGEIVFNQLYLRYSKTEPPVLKNLNFVIKPMEKIGIVGRTGAGKSSLISALFRLAELEGKILIDGVDTKTIGLHDLRGKLSIIPQEPVLFSGTMRKNLDPFDEYSDAVLWRALEEVELKDAVNDLIAGLNSKMSEGGSNFSVGQRQLVCLARAIVRNNRILVLDEATANVDPQTDSLIQTTIRHKFKDCTVLTIAHRLHTVMDSDKVLVMDAGTMVEFDHPYTLLQNPNGFLYKMVQQTGKATIDTLTKVAHESFKEKQRWSQESPKKEA